MNINSLVNSHLYQNGFKIMYEHIDKAPEEEFPKIRLMGFGASDSSKVLGVNPFQSRTQVINEKITGDYDETISQKPNVRKGKELEPMILDKAEAFFGQQIDKPSHMYGDGKGILVNFDGVMLDKGETLVPVEAKLVSIYGRKYYNFTKSASEFTPEDAIPESTKYPKDAKTAAMACGIPVYYYTQLQQQMLFLDSPYGYLVVLDDKEWELRIFKVYRNKKVIDEIVREIHLAQEIVNKRRLNNENDRNN